MKFKNMKNTVQLLTKPGTTNVSCVFCEPKYVAHTEHLSHPKPFQPHIKNKKPRSFSHLVMSYQIMRDVIGAFSNTARDLFFCLFNPIFK